MLKSLIVTAAAAAIVALPAGAQVQAATAARVNVKVDPGLANSARVSGDSAFALARAHAPNGEISSAELEMKDKRLVYEIHLLTPKKRATTVWVDANTGETLEATKHGGLKATLMHHKENKKLMDAKRDSAVKNP